LPPRVWPERAPHQIGIDIAVELTEAHQRGFGAGQHTPGDGRDFDFITDNGDFQAFVIVRAIESERNLGAFVTPDAINRLGKREAGHVLAVHLDDDVPGFDPGGGGRRAIEGGDDDRQAILDAQLRPNTKESAPNILFLFGNLIRG
jgi:hypothetical protein